MITRDVSPCAEVKDYHFNLLLQLMQILLDITSFRSEILLREIVKLHDAEKMFMTRLKQLIKINE